MDFFDIDRERERARVSKWMFMSSGYIDVHLVVALNFREKPMDAIIKPNTHAWKKNSRKTHIGHDESTLHFNGLDAYHLKPFLLNSITWIFVRIKKKSTENSIFALNLKKKKKLW